MAVRSFEQLLSFLVLLLLCANPALGTTVGKPWCIERERQALLKFKHGLVDDYGLLSSWGDEQDSRDCCQWRGVQCSNQSGHIIRIHLQAPRLENTFEYQSLRGEISPSLLELENLTHLDLSYNDFEGRHIPPFLGALSRMQYLNLSNANFTQTVPTQLGNLSNLLSLDLSNNYGLNLGNLEWLPRLSSLRDLDLSSIDLSKAIHWSQAINKLSSLAYLKLAGCRLHPLTTPSLSLDSSSAPLVFLDLSDNYLTSSSIYPWLFNFSTTLVHLDLSGNDLNGSIPNAFGNMISLAYLDLSSNGFTSSIFPLSFNFSTTLVHLDLSGNDLNGSIPDAFGNMVSLAYLDLSLNGFTSIFPWLFNFSTTLVHLDLWGNDLNGSIPDAFGNMISLAYLDLSWNGFTSIFPWSFNFSTTLVHLDLSGNDLNGSIPDTFGDMISLAYLDISNNGLHGKIPDAIGNMSSLTYLDLSGNQLDGEIPDAIGNMSSLTYLDLSGNQLDGEISDAIGNMSSLTYLHLSGNQLDGEISETIGNMSSLTYLHLSQNQLQGSIPYTVGNMVSLEQLSFSQNHLQGEIPKSLSNLCNLQALELDGNNLTGQLAPDFMACANGTLEALSLSDNQFSGSVPDLIGFSSLRELHIDFNQLNGTLPESIGQLANLKSLDIASNSLQGVISEAHLFNLSNLYRLDLSYNSLTFNMRSEWVPPFQLTYLLLASCKLGPRFPSWLHTQESLSELDISNSGISDVLPDWFWNSTFSFLNISNNQIKGTLPNLSSKFGDLADVYMSSNCFEGSIPQLPSHSLRLDLSNNKFSGSISLLCMVDNPEIRQLDLSNNVLTGGLPNCWENWESLVLLNLDNNRFSGQIPNSFGSLRSIQTLHLRNNNLTGELPLSFKNCTSLRFIDLAKNGLSGKIPDWIGESLPNLIVLNLGSNRFSGVIRPELCQLKNIQILDLSSNNMSSAIPRCLGNFTAMTRKRSLVVAHNYSFWQSACLYTRIRRGMAVVVSPSCSVPRRTSKNASYVDWAMVKWKGSEFEYKNTLGLVRSIDLSSNNLSGEIPKEITDLLELVSLNLSRNNLTGLIPAMIGQLKSLEVLDLSQNQLFGEIPTSLSEISLLSVLNLSSNNLSGQIPKGTQLQSFSTYSYQGNPTLCGLPLLKKCPEDKMGEDSPTCSIEDKIQQDGNDMWFYISIALGFIVGFWGVCGTLLLNNSLRYAYFHLLNKIKDWFYVTIVINMAKVRRSLRS